MGGGCTSNFAKCTLCKDGCLEVNRKHIGSHHFLEPLGPLEANLFEPNPVGKKYSMETETIEYSIKKVARSSSVSHMS